MSRQAAPIASTNTGRPKISTQRIARMLDGLSAGITGAEATEGLTPMACSWPASQKSDDSSSAALPGLERSLPN